jgi:hypothetical protein
MKTIILTSKNYREARLVHRLIEHLLDNSDIKNTVVFRGDECFIKIPSCKLQLQFVCLPRFLILFKDLIEKFNKK